MAVDPIPSDAQAVIDHCRSRSGHLVPLPPRRTRWLLRLAYGAMARIHARLHTPTPTSKE